jgi:HAMP domain-containing protein
MLRLGLRVKFFLYSNTLIVVTMSLVTRLGVVHERRSRREAIERRGRSICEAMAIPINDVLMNDDLEPGTAKGIIENYIFEIQARNRDLMRYVVVTDTQGKATHSSNWDLLGEYFEPELAEQAAEGPTVVQVPDGQDGARILEVRMPLNVSGGSGGSLIVGYSLGPIEQQVRAIAMRAALMALLLMIGNSALTAVYVETLIRPILDLNRTMKRAARGDLSVRARSRAGAEVGELTEAFNRMMDVIEEAREQEKFRRVQLAHTEKMAAVGTLAAGVAHEVNNPLGGILACVENMRADLEDRQLLERYLEVIHDGLQRIEHTVANLAHNGAGANFGQPQRATRGGARGVPASRGANRSGLRPRPRGTHRDGGPIPGGSAIPQLSAQRRSGDAGWRPAHAANPAKGRERPCRGLRHGGRYSREHTPTDLRSVLHHAGCGQGHGTWTDGERQHRRVARRYTGSGQHPGQGVDF